MWRERSKGPFRGQRRGVTLLETLISVAIFSATTAGIFLLYTTMQGTMNRGELKTDLQQNARVGLDRMIQELRMAGYDPSGALQDSSIQPPPRAAIRAAASGCLSFVADVAGSGASSQITYDLSGTTLRRREDNWNASSHVFSGGSAQPQAESVALLSFTYYDAYNRVLSFPTAPGWVSTHRCPPTSGTTAQAIVQLDYWQLRQVRRVAITLRTQESRPGVASEFFTLTSDVRLRNR